MKIAIFGATGKVGRVIVREALSRGHEVTAVLRNQARVDDLPVAADARSGDASKIEDVVAVSRGQDVVINATRPPVGRENEAIATTRGMMDGLAMTGVRLLVVGGAASLVVPGSGGATVLDDPRFLAPALRRVGEASVDQYRVCLDEKRVDWAYLSPPADLVPGVRSGKYRLGRDELLLDNDGNSRISVEDLAVALIDEAERPAHHRERFTVAY